VTQGEDRQDAARGGEAAQREDHAALVARVHEELEAARRRVCDAWVQYQQRAAGEHTREAVAVSPLLTALVAYVS
jgi:hypothetical protein